MRSVLVAMLVLTSSLAHAYPIPPAPLWDLTAEADLIVVAKVVANETYQQQDDPWNSQVAILTVKETWKGEPVEQLRVPYPAGLLCPAPPRYLAGETVLAFLRRGDEGQWSTVSLSYGTLYPSIKQIAAFRQQVKAALALQIFSDIEDAAIVAWHVDTAARRATRWHGLYRLEPTADRAHCYYDPECKPAKDLPPSEQLRLAEGWVREPDVGRSLPMVLSLLVGLEHQGVDATAVAAIDALMEEDELPHWTGPTMALTLARVGRAEAWTPPPEQEDPLLKDPLIGGLPSKSDKKLRALWIEHRPQIDVAEMTLKRLRQPRVYGVGGATPP